MNETQSSPTQTQEKWADELATYFAKGVHPSEYEMIHASYKSKLLASIDRLLAKQKQCRGCNRIDVNEEGFCSECAQELEANRKALEKKDPASDSVKVTGQNELLPPTEPNDKYYGAWREANDLVLFKLPGQEPFRISNTAAERLYDDFAKICGEQAPPSEDTKQASEEKET